MRGVAEVRAPVVEESIGNFDAITDSTAVNLRV
jgi:hypothetical protein